MSLQVEKLENNMAKLTIEVSAEELEKANEKFLKRFREELEAWRVRNGSGNEEQP